MCLVFVYIPSTWLWFKFVSDNYGIYGFNWSCLLSYFLKFNWMDPEWTINSNFTALEFIVLILFAWISCFLSYSLLNCAWFSSCLYYVMLHDCVFIVAPSKSLSILFHLLICICRYQYLHLQSMFFFYFFGISQHLNHRNNSMLIIDHISEDKFLLFIFIAYSNFIS